MHWNGTSSSKYFNSDRDEIWSQWVTCTYLSMTARGHKGHKDRQTTILKCHFWKKIIKNMKVWGWKYEMYGAVLRSACSSKRGDGGRQFRGKTQQIAASARCCLGCQVGCLGFGGQACCLGFGGQTCCLGFGSVKWVGWQFDHLECQSDWCKATNFQEDEKRHL